MAGERRKLRVEIDIYGVDKDADAAHVAQAIGLPLGNPVGFDDLDGYDDEDLAFDTTHAEWVD